MSEQPLFSILIANYNNGRYLQEAIDSVLAQTYTHWEIVLIDDGSTDNSRQVYDRYQHDSRFHIYYNGENKGCGCTKRKLTELAQGELRGFLDADDLLLPEALALHVEAHRTHPKAPIIYSRNYFCDAEGNVMKESQYIDFAPGDTYFDHRWVGPVNFASYKQSYYQLTEGISPRLKAGIDQDLYFKLEEQGDVFMINAFTYKYMQRNRTSINSNDTKLWYWNMEVRRDACRRRGLDADATLYPDWEFVVNNVIIRNAVYTREREIRASLPYRIGRILTSPFRIFKSQKK